MFCKNCGKELNEGMKFCNNCGTKIENQNVQPVENQSATENQNVQPVENQSATENQNVQPIVNQPVTDNQLMNQNIQPNYSNQPMGPKKESNVFLIIIIIVLLVVAGVFITIFLTSKNDNKTNNKHSSNENEYENNAIVDNTTTTTTTTKYTNSNVNNTNNQNDAIEFDGFDFKKISGYKYSKDDEHLNIVDTTKYVAVSVKIVPEGFNDAVLEKDDIKSSIEKQGYKVENFKNSTYKGVKVFTYEVTNGNQKLLYYVAEAPADDTVFAGAVYNKQYTIDYNNLNVLADIVKSSKESSSYNKSAKNKNFEISSKEDIFE